ncbi:MAG: cytochrome P450 [Rhodomicrobium sp.]|nr:cytochrome P450 [Rhodomicrobium sp.]
MDNAAARQNAQDRGWNSGEIETGAGTGSDAETDAYRAAQELGEQPSIWFKLSVLTKPDNPIQVLQRLSEKMNGCIRVNLKDQRIFFLSEAEHFKHVLLTQADNYGKYFDGLKPVFGRAMITVDGALWQKIRIPQQAAFQPKMFGEYLPYFLSSVQDKARELGRYAKTGETVNLLEETWGLAASMVCKALFDRDMPFNPHAIFRAIKSYTDVSHHRTIRLRKVKGELTEVPADDAAANAIASWLTIIPELLGAVPRDHRERTLLTMLQAAAADPDRPEFDRQQVLDEMKQYLWAGTETTALTLTWCFYLLHFHPEAAERIRQEAGDAYGDRVPSWDDIHALSYTRAVIQETMRLYPPVWSIIRVALAEDEIAGHGVLPGDKIVLCPYIAHHSARYWDEPEKFDPSRFMPENAKKRAPYSYLPFSAGKRACIGGALSIVENTLALAGLLRQFRFEYAGEVPARMSATVTLTPQGGRLPFRVHAR